MGALDQPFAKELPTAYQPALTVMFWPLPGSGIRFLEVPMAEITRLPGPVADLWDWQLDGACRRVGPEVFFHPEGERGSKRRTRASAAKEICLTCPVLKQCRSHALAVREPYGVWGGLTEDERETVYARDRHIAS
jgi:WhiB family redox-sensing transcriptional regulator